MGYNKIIANGKTYIDLTGDDVTAANLLRGTKAHDNAGDQIVGECDFDMDTSAATATAADILADQTAGVNGTMVTGSMPNLGGASGSINTKDGEYTIGMGFHDGSGKVGLDATEKAKLIPENIKEGVDLFGVTGTLAPASGVTAQAKSADPSFTEQTILPDAGYDYLTQVTIGAIPVVETPNATGITVVIG